MTYRGKVQKGVIVVDGPVALPEGAEVYVELVRANGEEALLDENGRTLGQKLMKYAGKAVGLPSDAARNHDHYLYGSPKK